MLYNVLYYTITYTCVCMYVKDKNSAPSAEAAFKAISTAFDTLNDLQKREIYDQVRVLLYVLRWCIYVYSMYQYVYLWYSVVCL